MIASVQNATSAASATASTTEAEARKAVLALIETYRQGFLHLDLERLASIWDHQHVPLVYVAQEMDQPILGWTNIQHYLASLPEHLDEVSAKELDDVQIDVLGDTATAFFTSHSSVKLKAHPTINYKPIGHVSMIFHRTSEGWRVIHFHESARSSQAVQVVKAIQAKQTVGESRRLRTNNTERPSLAIGKQAAQDASEAVSRLVAELQAATDNNDAYAYDRSFASDVLWGSPYGETVHGYETLHAIHARLHEQPSGSPAAHSRFEIDRVLVPAPDVAIAHVRRVALDLEGQPLKPTSDVGRRFSEMALYVLIRRDGSWWLGAGQNTVVRPGLSSAGSSQAE